VNGIDSLHLTPGVDDLPSLVWAIYRLPGLAPDANVTTLSAGLSQMEPGQDYYFALADYELGGWQMLARTAASADETFNFAAAFDAARHLSSAGSVFFAVLAHNHGCDVDFISLLASTSLATPQNLTASDGAYPDAVSVTWDVVPGAEMYDVFYKEADQPDEFYGFLVEVSGDTDSPGFSHTDTFPPGKTALYAQEYEYKVRATAGGEDPSPFSTPDVGRRQLPAPRDFLATDRLHPEAVVGAFRSPQTWPGMRSFKLFRDGEDTGVDDFTSLGDWFFITSYELDADEHEYYVIETGPEGDSPPSAVDTGSLILWTDTLITRSNVFIGQFYADMDYAAHDPILPAVCFREPATDWLRYGWVNSELEAVHFQVVQAEPDADMSLLTFGGRPWIAYDNKNETFGTEGVYIARGKVAAPAAPTDWDVYPLELNPVRGGNIALEEIGGRLAVVFSSEFDAAHHLRYGFALNDDPQSAADWAVADIVAHPTGDLQEHFATIEFQGLPLVAYQGHDGLSVAQAISLTPGGSGDWTSYELPLSGRIASRAEGVDLVYQGSTVIVASIEGGAESPGQLIISRTDNWPPGPTDWQELQLFDSDAIMHGGISLVHRGPKPYLAWSGEDTEGLRISAPAVLSDDILWNEYQWVEHDVVPAGDYNESIYNVRLVRTGNGDLAALYTMELYDGEYKYDLICSQVVLP
jgi:hypothetical protein